VLMRGTASAVVVCLGKLESTQADTRADIGVAVGALDSLPGLGGVATVSFEAMKGGASGIVLACMAR